MKELSSMTDRELLLELVAEKRRADRARRIKAYIWMAVAAALLVLCLIYVPRVVRTVRHYNQVIDQVTQTVTEAQGLLDGLKAVGTEKLQDTAVQMNTRLFKTTIREGTAIKEAQAMKQDIYAYAPRSNVAMDYARFVDEFLKEEKKHG